MSLSISNTGEFFLEEQEYDYEDIKSHMMVDKESEIYDADSKQSTADF